jgi:rhodanese-related sulfurtransferase
VPKGIDVARAQRLIKRGAQLVDVLPHSMYTQEHLPGALSLPLETMSPATASKMDRAQAVVVYCFDQH